MLLSPGGLVISAAILLAQAGSVPTVPVPSKVSVVVAGNDAEAARVLDALTDATRRLGIGLDVRRGATAFVRGEGPNLALSPPDPVQPPMTARLWLDLGERESVTLYVADDQRERVFVRRFDTPSGLDEVALEQLALAASSSIEAILAGHLIGVARRDYEASLRVEKPAPISQPAAVEPQVRAAGSLSFAYTASLLGPGAPTHGPAFGVKLDRARWGLGLWAHARLPIVVGADGADDVQVTLTTIGLRYRAWLTVQLSPNVILSPGIGVGADFTRVSPRGDATSGVAPLERFWAADGLVQGLGGIGYRTRSWSVAGALGADLSMQPVRYALDRSSGMTDVFVPFRVRPFIEIEFAAVVLP